VEVDDMNIEKKLANCSRKTKEFVALAYVQDKSLAKDYLEILQENEIEAKIQNLPGDQQEQGYEVSIVVNQEQLEAALEAIKVKSPGYYFYSDLFDYSGLNDDTEDFEDE
jgi:hypothetical protein